MPTPSLKEFTNLALRPGQAIKEVLCVQPEKKGYLYGVFKLEDNTFIAAWKGHHKHADTLEELKHLLNGHEKMLLTFKVQE